VNKLYFKIWCTEKKLYSKGGSPADKRMWCWSETGKVWTGIGPLKNHLRQFKTIPDSWLIVPIKVISTPDLNNTYKASSLLKDYMNYHKNIKPDDIDLKDLVGPFDMRTEPPTRNGVYLTQHDKEFYNNEDEYSLTFQTYNGEFWGKYTFHTYKATEFLDDPSSFQHGKWWGLKQEVL